MRSSTSQYSSLIAWSVVASLVALGWSAGVATEGISAKKGPGEDSEIAAPAKYDPATFQPATDKPTDKPKPAADKPAADKPAADKPAAGKPTTDEPATDEPDMDEPDADAPAMDDSPDDSEMEDAETEDPDAVKPAPKAVPSAASARPRKLRFQFRFIPWKDALEWFAQQADLSLMADTLPAGTLSYSDDREYTPVEALDLLNGVLLTKGYTLVRRERMLILINLEDGIPPNLVPTITPDGLDGRGEYELVSVLFNLEKLRPEEAEAEIIKLLGPQGSLVPLGRARQILVTETAGRLRAILSILSRIEESVDEKEGPADVLGLPRARRIPLQNTQAQELAEIVRQVYSGRLIEGPGAMRGGRTITPPRTEGSSGAATVGEAGRPHEELRLTVSVDARSNSLVVVAPRELFQEVKQLVEDLDLAAGDQDQTLRVVPLHRVTLEAVQQALSAAGGDLAQFGAHTPGGASSTSAVPRQPLSPSLPTAPRAGVGQSRLPELGQGAGVSSGPTVRTQPSRVPYYRGRSAAPSSVTVP